MSEKPKFREDAVRTLGKKILLSSMSKALLGVMLVPYGGKANFSAELEKAIGKPLHTLSAPEEFLCPELRKSIVRLTDKDYLRRIEELLAIKCQGQYASTMSRRSFGSHFFGHRVYTVLDSFVCWMRFYFFEENVAQMLQMESSQVRDLKDQIALEINRGNEEVIHLIKEAILGDNNGSISYEILQGIMLSSNQELKELVKNLLLAAKQQEGLRQAILEHADAASLPTFLFFLKTCVEHDLFRYSSAARALYTWTGLYREEVDVKFSRWLGQTAYECLADSEKRALYLESDHPLENYLAIWAMGCEEIEDTHMYLEKLLSSPKMHLRFLAWHMISQTGSETFQHKLAVSHLDEEDIRLVALATDHLHVNWSACYAYPHRQSDFIAKAFPDSIYPDCKEERRQLFDKLLPIAERIGNNEWKFPHYLFDWTNLIINNQRADVIPCMMSLAAYDLDEEMIEKLSAFRIYMEPDRRAGFYVHLLSPDTNPKHREMLYEGLSDKSPTVKEICIRKLMQQTATHEDIRQVTALLKTKSASLRKLVTTYLTALSLPDMEHAIRLLTVGNDTQLQIAAELIQKEEALSKLRSLVLERSRQIKVSDQTMLLVRQLFLEEVESDSKGEEISEKNGYGLYDPAKVAKRAEELANYGELPLLKEKEIRKAFPNKKEQETLLEALNQIFESHKDYEYEYLDYSGQKNKILFGDSTGYQGTVYIPAECGRHREWEQKHEITLSMLPFGDEFEAVLAPLCEDSRKFAALVLMAQNSFPWIEQQSFYPWIREFADHFCVTFDSELASKYKNRFRQLLYVIRVAYQSAANEDVFREILIFYQSLIQILGFENIKKDYKDAPHYFGPDYHVYAGNLPLFTNLRFMLMQKQVGDALFQLYFAREYALEHATGFEIFQVLELKDFLRAKELGLVTEEAICAWLLLPGRINRQVLETFTTLSVGIGKSFADQYPWMRPLSQKLVRNVVRFEAMRGQNDTALSNKVPYIGKYYGIEFFVLLLQGLGTEDFYRGWIWSASTKQANLSILLRRVYPDKGETAEDLRKALEGSDIKEKRLIEAAMYSPQWAPLIEELTGWKGLKKTVWFFHAHISEHFNSDKETEVAIYSPISPQKFNDGAFDINWFQDCYEEIGEKRFKTLYKCAKYITEGSNAHRRSQLFSDAVTGKFDSKELEQEILDKRNQEKLRAYALIPLPSDGDRELMHRYAFLCDFRKSGKQFGAQRRESEKKAVDIAMENLAVTCGLFDVNRMLWRLEKQKTEEIRPLLSGKSMDEYEVSLKIDENGDPSLCCMKAGKELKTLPKALAKQEYVEYLKQQVKELKEQKRRSRETLENAMVNRTEFGFEELVNVLNSLTIAPMAEKLVWTDGKNLGFPMLRDGSIALIDADGQVQAAASDAAFSIAHPYHLIQAGQWAQYMHFLYEKNMVQPFKQVFREYYPLTEEEGEEGVVSRRYAGYQVQTKKTAALLKSRGWTIDYEEGLQKVSYSDDVVVRMFAYADWFSPADIEAPTLEEIRFYSRKDGTPLPLCEINPILFSEIMRDLDLVVSVAYVGGVDAETSHSTVELRMAIARELLQLLRVKNVEFLERHVKIYGKLAEYSVHMGSGVVHAKEKGMLMILPVHSQHRGRIFLPFADEDPKTAEIMSKILLLAEDGKIKDPSILKQLS